MTTGGTSALGTAARATAAPAKPAIQLKARSSRCGASARTTR